MSDRSDFVGTWSLESFRATGPAGEPIYPLGETVIGRITYHADGRMSVQVMSRDRARFTTEDPLRAPDDEIAQAFATYIGYLGTYSVDRETSEVTHHLEVASIPNWVGTDQKRVFEFGEGTLQLSTPPMHIGGAGVVSVLLWRRDTEGD